MYATICLTMKYSIERFLEFTSLIRTILAGTRFSTDIQNPVHSWPRPHTDVFPEVPLAPCFTLSSTGLRLCFRLRIVVLPQQAGPWCLRFGYPDHAYKRVSSDSFLTRPFSRFAYYVFSIFLLFVTLALCWSCPHHASQWGAPNHQ